MRKFLPYILIFIILGGLFIPTVQVHAETDYEKCVASNRELAQNANDGTTYADCSKLAGAPASGQSGLAENIPGCAVITGDFDDCIVKITYIIFYTIPAFFLGLAASTFNLIISLTLSSTLYTNSTFIPEAWGVVRDLSNLFFILILLYIGIKMILGLGGHDVKKMVVQVIIMALLINFSMFFSKIIIDSANILALVFYDKIDVCTEVSGQNMVNGQPKPCVNYLPISDPAKTGIVEKDIAGGIVSAFDPSRMLSEEFFIKAKEKSQVFSVSAAGFATFVGGGALAGSFIPFVGTAIGAGVGTIAYGIKTIVGYAVPSKSIPTPLLLGIILISGLTMAFAAYSFTVVGIAFLSRLIELWVLIIFSPFAFMSSSVPFLAKAEGIGWDEWIKSLVRVSFMAPIFMFFLYLTFKLINAKFFFHLSSN